MRIGLFPLWAGSQIGGIATYDAELLPALARVAPDVEFDVYSAAAETGVHAANVRHHRLFPRSRWINVAVSLPVATAFSRAELLHMTHVPPPLSPRPYVMTLHCLSTFLHPEFYPAGLAMRINALVRRGARAARLVICVSETLRSLAEAELGIDRDRLAVAHNGVSAAFCPGPRDEAARRVKEMYGLDAPYLLFVGVIAPRKNVARLVEAFARYRRRRRSSVRLVLVGRKWIAGDVDEAVRRHGVEDDVVSIAHVANAQLPDLYRAAEMLVFPSLWESFGIPVVEAMACGTPVITSRISCLPEIAGDAALCVDPYSADDIANGIERVLGDPAMAARMRSMGLLRARQFTWENTARRTVDAYRQAIAA